MKLAAERDVTHSDSDSWHNPNASCCKIQILHKWQVMGAHNTALVWMNKMWRRPGPQPPPVCAGCPPSAPPPLGTCRSGWPGSAPGRPAGSPPRSAPCRRSPTTSTNSNTPTAAWYRTSFAPLPLSTEQQRIVTHRGRTAAHSWIRFIWKVWVAVAVIG